MSSGSVSFTADPRKVIKRTEQAFRNPGDYALGLATGTAGQQSYHTPTQEEIVQMTDEAKRQAEADVALAESQQKAAEAAAVQKEAERRRTRSEERRRRATLLNRTSARGSNVGQKTLLGA